MNIIKNQKLQSQSFVIKYKNHLDNKPFFKQIFKYSIVGVLNTIIGLTAMFVFYNIYKVDYILTNIIAYMLGLINSFVFNKRWTFASKQHYSKEILPFLCVFLIGYAANLLTLITTVEVFKINPNISQVFGIGAYSSTNFLLNRYWTFSKSH